MVGGTGRTTVKDIRPCSRGSAVGYGLALVHVHWYSWVTQGFVPVFACGAEDTQFRKVWFFFKRFSRAQRSRNIDHQHGAVGRQMGSELIVGKVREDVSEGRHALSGFTWCFCKRVILLSIIII
jgi:hypothetical protein